MLVFVNAWYNMAGIVRSSSSCSESSIYILIIVIISATIIALEDSAKFDQVFTCLNFATVFFLQYKVVSLASNL
jgi:hypothetical protein